MPNSRLWPIVLLVLFFCLLVIGIALLFKTAWITVLLTALVLLVSALIIISSIRASRDITILSKISVPKKPDDNILAYKLLTEIDLAPGDKKSLAMKASEVLREKFQLERFAVFFKENDKYVLRVYSGLNKGDLAIPAANKFSPSLVENIQTGALSNNESDYQLAFKRTGFNFESSTVAFAYSWGKTRSVYLVGDDPKGRFSEVAKDLEFNRIFWPGLENDLKLNQKLYERGQENRELTQLLEQAKRDVSELNNELKNRLLDLKAFVKISNDLYSLFDETELFSRLKKTVCEKLGAVSAQILVPSGDGHFIPAGEAEQSETILSLDSDSELAELLSQSARPVLLPLAGTGYKHDEPFLRAALGANFQIASSIKADGKPACILLVSQKMDKTQYTSLELDFLYIISNIASLALDNIHQYSTIEKLSYTDSMTQIYNYRYFYKRLSEEVLRAKRYDRELALVILDIDNFKSFNDNYGHQAGDLVLRQLSDLITKTIRSIDVVSRYGGEEFCIIMPDTGIGDCETFIERLRCQIADFKFESELFPQGGKISVSVGGAVYPHYASMPDRLIYCADMALLKAKSLGRNRAVMYEPEAPVDSKSMEGGFNESHQESIL
ncbi:MAG TPA: hypothetical protein DCZ43_02715 [candidate division Zixibacteria bacterium]|nr:hypothetical protein [candidate division Zixibacteria bacterium]